MSIDISLLPRADLPVIWDDFKAKAELVRTTAETLTVTCITQKEEMALARKTRLTLREIRVAVEHKRVELGEGHLKEIQKVNGAAKALREFIEPLEARLLDQETFAERAEALRLGELAISRITELKFIRPNFVGVNLAEMSQEEYDKLLASLKHEKAELEAANRLRIEAEKRLEEQQIEMRRQMLEAQTKAAADLAEVKRQEGIRFIEEEARKATERVAVIVAQNLERAAQEEKDRIRDEQLAKLEAELKAERAAKQAEADAARRLALAPDVEKLWAFAGLLRGIDCSGVTSEPGKNLVQSVLRQLRVQAEHIERFCQAEGLTTPPTVVC